MHGTGNTIRINENGELEEVIPATAEKQDTSERETAQENGEGADAAAPVSPSQIPAPSEYIAVPDKPKGKQKPQQE